MKPHRGHRDFEKVNKLYCVYGAGDFVMMAPMAVVETVFRMDEYSVRRVIKETRGWPRRTRPGLRQFCLEMCEVPHPLAWDHRASIPHAGCEWGATS
jgi:hypothetical protein